MIGLTKLAPFIGILSLIIAWLIYGYVKKQPNGTPLMQELEDAIHTGAMAFLKKEYSVLIIFIAIVFILLGWGIAWKTAICFVTGALCSMAAGFSGMTAATRGNSRTAEAANKSGQAKALNVSYFSGSVMGLAVAGLGLLGLGFWFWVYGGNPETAEYINGFAMGASSIALFARVGGGVYTKAADVGADLVGKVEAGIPEDDPRNPGVIADNVGDNVGDIAGMGADIFESFVGSVIATIAIAATLSINTPETLGAFVKQFPVLQGLDATAIKLKYMAMPILIIMVGLLSSFVGVFSIKIFQKGSPAGALRYTTFVAAIIFVILTIAVTKGLGMPMGCFLGDLLGAPLRYRHRASGRILHFRSSGETDCRAERDRRGDGDYCGSGRRHAVHVASDPWYLRRDLCRLSLSWNLRNRSFRGGYACHGWGYHDGGCVWTHC